MAEKRSARFYLAIGGAIACWAVSLGFLVQGIAFSFSSGEGHGPSTGAVLLPYMGAAALSFLIGMACASTTEKSMNANELAADRASSKDPEPAAHS